MNVDAGATLEVNGSTYNFALDPGETLGGTGDVLFSAGTANISGDDNAYTVTGATRVTSGTANFNLTATSTNLAQSAGTVAGSGTLTVETFDWTGGNQHGSGTTDVTTQLNITGGTGKSLQRTVLNQTAATWSGGTINSGQGGVLRNVVGATFDITGNDSFSFNQGGTRTILDNDGTLTKHTGTGTTSIGAAFANNGVVAVQSGRIAATTGGGAGGATVPNLFEIQAGVVLPGSGTFNSDVLNAGTLTPGNSPGTVTVNGDYTQAAGGSFNVEIGGLNAGSEFDQLIVTGTAALAGTLNVTLIDPFVPQLNNSFLILDGTVVGAFDTVNLPGLPFPLDWQVDISSVTLSVVPLPCSLDVTTTADDGPGSLREAIICANVTPGPDVINLPAGTYTLDLVGAGEDAAATGDLDITDDLTIVGAGSGTTIIDAAGLDADGAGTGFGDRVFEVVGAVSLEVSGVTIRNGNVQGFGGGINAHDNDSTLTVTDSVISNNTATGFGGAINLNSGGITANVTNSTLMGNVADGSGGGINNNSSGTVIVFGSTISNNEESGFGGGGLNNNSNGPMTIEDSVISGNISDQRGGGINNNGNGTLTITRTMITGNMVLGNDRDGGGISKNSGGAVTITDSTISDNTASGSGGGIHNNSSGDPLTIVRSTISGNTATEDGGGINNNSSGQIDITNSTISGNMAGIDGGGISNNSRGEINLTNATVAFNTAGGLGNGVFSVLVGGTVNNVPVPGGPINLTNTIMADNGAANCAGAGVSTPLISLGSNLDTDGTCNFNATGDISNADAMLGPLQDNGGLTFTHEVLLGSAAIDKGDDTAAPATDQRGVDRPQGAASDIGAFESDECSLVVINTNDSGSGSLRDAIICANATPGLDTITFDIPGAGAHTIQPLTQLPDITDPVIIDGYSQSGASENTSTVASRAALNTDLRVVIDGSLAGDGANGLHVSAGGSTIKGLVINQFMEDASDPFNRIGGFGILLSSAGGNVITGNFIGTDVTGTVDLGNEAGVVGVDSPNNTFGGTTPEARNLISGNSDGGITLEGLPSTNNLIAGNIIGLDLTGTADLGNGDGVVITEGASTNTVGGNTLPFSNLISGNNREGVRILDRNVGFVGTSNNVVEGNVIGLDITGTTFDPDGVLFNGDELGNRLGVRIDNSPNNRVGGTTGVTPGGAATGSANVISGNTSVEAIFITGPQSDDNIVQGNYLGTDITGTVGLRNGTGIQLSQGTGNLIGGDTPEERNIIAAANAAGIILSGTNNTVQGNYIGTDTTGTIALANDTGVQVGGTDNLVGGSNPGEGNLISGNERFGVRLGGENHVVQGNLIGTQADGASAPGNLGQGVLLPAGSVNNTIGGTGDGAGNTIAFNGAGGGPLAIAPTGGVTVNEQFGSGVPAGNVILGNSIHSNVVLGIDLNDNGVTPNDNGDADVGANNLQNFPVLDSAVNTGTTTVTGTLNSLPNSDFRLEFFSNSALDPSGHGEGETFLGSTDVSTDAGGDAPFSFNSPIAVADGDFVTSTATLLDGSQQPVETSEFSAGIQVSGAFADIDIQKLTNGADADVPDGSDVPQILPGNTVLWTYQVTNTGDVPFFFDDVFVNDDNGTPSFSGDDFTPTFDPTHDTGSDLILSPGETWVYTATQPAQDLSQPSGEGQSTLVVDGIYSLHNHPAGLVAAPFYGLRLDGLTTGDASDVFTFDFDHPSSNVTMEVNDTTIKIFGTAFGGLDIGNDYAPQESGLWDLSFTYDNVQKASGDDDLLVDDSRSGTNTGTITQLFGSGDSFDLEDFAGSFPFTMRLGDEDSDAGHRGFTGISGFGWLNHSGGSGHLEHSDWLFTAQLEQVEQEIGVYENQATVDADGAEGAVSAFDSDFSHYTNPSLDAASVTQSSEAPAQVALSTSAPTSDVTAQVKRGRLQIDGDGASNHVMVEQLGAGTYQVTGMNGTGVNGSAAGVLLEGIKRGLKARLGDGDNTLQIGTDQNATTFAQVNVRGDRGSDTIMMRNAQVTGLTRLTTRDGADHVELHDSILNRLKLNTGRDGDEVMLASTTVARSQVSTQGGDDKVMYDALTDSDRGTVKTGKGDDQIMVKGSTLFASELLSGSGSDQIDLLDSILGRTRLDVDDRVDLLEVINTFFELV